MEKDFTKIYVNKENFLLQKYTEYIFVKDDKEFLSIRFLEDKRGQYIEILYYFDVFQIKLLNYLNDKYKKIEWYEFIFSDYLKYLLGNEDKIFFKYTDNKKFNTKEKYEEFKIFLKEKLGV